MRSAFSTLRLSEVGYIIEGFVNALTAIMAREDNILRKHVVWSERAKRKASDAVTDYLCNTTDSDFRKKISDNTAYFENSHGPYGFEKIGTALATGAKGFPELDLVATARYENGSYELGL